LLGSCSPEEKKTYKKEERGGLFAVQVGGKIGFINKEGKLIVNPQFDDVGNFSEGLARVTIGDKWGYIDKEGKYVVNPQFDYERETITGTLRFQKTEKGWKGEDGKIY
jgi:hypothetical protein